VNQVAGDKLRIVVFKDGDTYVAQALEHDICTQAPDMKSLRRRMDALVDAERASGKAAFDSIAPAPKHYFDMWDGRWGATAHEVDAPVERDYALCA
jgi:hypothetical protein